MDEDDLELLGEFLLESHEGLDQLDADLVALEQEPGSRELLSSIFRTIHTIKGTSGFLALNRLEALTHAGENLLSRLRDGELELTSHRAGVLLRLVDTVRALLALIETSHTDVGDVEVDPVVAAVVAATEDDVETVVETVVPVDELPTVDPAAAVVEENETGDARRSSVVDNSVRVDVDLLDRLVQLVGELVLTRNQILQKLDRVDDVDLTRAAQRLNLVASELQEGVMRTRMQPIGQVWGKMPRIVRDLAHQLGRQVDLEMSGHDTELDRSLLEAVRGPLTHLVRNALDHGLESPHDRVAAGKPATGRLLLRAYHESGQVVVEISDDGRGIDLDKVAAIAVDRGVVGREQLRLMEPREVQDLIFRPGFSTASEVTNVSGRGVGMDVVRTNIERIGGSVDLTSVPGQGTTCRVRIPLTLAIIPALLVGEGAESYAIPQANLVELVRVETSELAGSVEVLAGAPVLRLRGDLLPLVSLGETLGVPRPVTEAVTVVVVQAEDVRFGLSVEEVHDTQEIVVKPIGRQLKGLGVYAGATIMGDGRVSLILDVAGLARANGVEANAATTRTEQVATTADPTHSLLVVEAAPGRRAALPLGEISRLEEIDRGTLEWSGDREVVQYRGGILPLVRLGRLIGLAPDDDPTSTTLPVVVREHEGARVGIVIDRVVDVAETVVELTDVGRRPGVRGSAIVNGHVTDLVDLEELVALGATAGAVS